MIFKPTEVLGWRLGRAHKPRGGELWVPWDRTTGVIGPQGSGKTLDLLAPALLQAPGAALVTLTKVDDLLLSFAVRSGDDRPCVVLDPFGLAAGLPELIWDPVAGCVDSMVAERRAKAFTAGTIKGAVAGGHGDDAARFYAAEAAKVIHAFFHAAALTGRTLDHVLRWVANPSIATDPTEILREHPHAAPYWHGLLQGALHGDDRTAGNTITTVQQAMSLFFQDDIRRRCVPGRGRPATDLADLIGRGGTIYLLGREDPYASASPLMTAVAELVFGHRVDACGQVGGGVGCAHRCWPVWMSCIDRAAADFADPDGHRARPRGFVHLCGADVAAAGRGLRRAGSARAVWSDQCVGDVRRLEEWCVQPGDLRSGRPDPGFPNQLANRRHGRPYFSGEDIAIIRPEEIRQLPERHALVIAENGKPIIARLSRCIDGKTGAPLLAGQAGLRAQLADRYSTATTAEARAAVALVEARRRGIVADPGSDR